MKNYSSKDTQYLLETIAYFSDQDNIKALDDARVKYAPNIGSMKDVAEQLAQIAKPLDVLDRFVSGELEPAESAAGIEIANSLKKIDDSATIVGHQDAPDIVRELNAARSSFIEAAEAIQQLSRAMRIVDPKMQALREKIRGIKPTALPSDPKVINDTIRIAAQSILEANGGEHYGRLKVLTTEFITGGFMENVPENMDEMHDLEQIAKASTEISHPTGQQKNPFTLENHINDLIHAAYKKAQSHQDRGGGFNRGA